MAEILGKPIVVGLYIQEQQLPIEVEMRAAYAVSQPVMREANKILMAQNILMTIDEFTITVYS